MKYAMSIKKKNPHVFDLGLLNCQLKFRMQLAKYRKTQCPLRNASPRFQSHVLFYFEKKINDFNKTVTESH